MINFLDNPEYDFFERTDFIDLPVNCVIVRIEPVDAIGEVVALPMDTYVLARPRLKIVTKRLIEPPI